MKLFRFGEPGRERAGALDHTGTRRDISSAIPDITGATLASHNILALKHLDLTALPAIPANARLGPCLKNVGNFIAVGLNYVDHARESGAAIPEEPILFNKAPSCVSGPDDDILLPPGSNKTDWEVELAIVIGEACSYISQAESSSVIAGYCICNDVSERQFQLERGGQWTKGKSSPSFGPLGPFLVTPDEIGDVQNLTMWLNVNGEPMQRGSTRDMIFQVPYLISYISHFMALEPGDVITTGTPAGVGLGKNPQRFLREGDVIELGIERLGEQRQRVVSKRSA